MSLDDLAEAMTQAGRPASAASLARLERGERDPTLDEALALAWWFSASPTAWLTPADDDALAVTTRDALDAETAQAWLRFGLGSAERWRAQLAEDVALNIGNHARRALKAAAGAQDDAALKAIRAALEGALVKTMTDYRKAHKRYVDDPKRPYGWDGMPTVADKS